MNWSRLLLRLLLGRRLPRTRGSLRVPGLHASVCVHRDRHGIPLIEADDDRDGPFALGFCHGQDRAFQLEVLLRVARGTVAAMVGDAALPLDRLARRVGFHRAAVAQLPALDADVRGMLDAYAAGVNAGVTRGLARLPHEFVLLGIQPTPWTPEDTLAVTKVLSFKLASNWDAELVRLKVLTTDGPAALQALETPYPGWHPVLTPVGASAGVAVDRLAEELATFFAWATPGGGSNNWVVAGSRTRTGRPLLANDPHLGANHPSHWYLASLRTSSAAVAGATFVGGPAFLIGHNGYAAWGLTAGLVDNSDLFLEEFGPDGVSVRAGDGSEPCRVVEEVIAVKGGESVTERVLVTPRGPIISPALADTPHALSLRATWLDPLPTGGFFRVHHVKSFADFRAAFADWPVAAQNMAYADRDGHIGWQLIGRAPVRKKGHGILPLHGADPATGWLPDPVPYDQMPRLLDPPGGYLATANTRHQPEGEGPFLSVDFIDGYRLMAINQALGQRTDWDVASTMRLQMDRYAPAWQEMRDVVLAAPVANEDVEVALDLLRRWDGDVAADSPAAAVYELFLVEMLTRITQAKAPQSWRWMLGAGLSPLTPYNFYCYRRTGHLVRLVREQPAGWFSQPWPAVVAEALAAAVQRLEVLRGPRPAEWLWGGLRPLVMHHPLSKKPGPVGRFLANVFNLGPVPYGGDADVINQAAVLPLFPLEPADNIASVRAVLDVGAWENSRFALPGGQSGNPLSPHYADLFPLWLRGDGVPIAYTPEEVRRATVETLVLTSE